MTYALKMDNFNENMKDELDGARKMRLIIFLIKKLVNWVQHTHSKVHKY